MIDLLNPNNSTDPVYKVIYGEKNKRTKKIPTDEFGNLYGYDSTNTSDTYGTFRYNWYCSLFDTMKSLPQETLKSKLFWTLSTGYSPMGNTKGGMKWPELDTCTAVSRRRSNTASSGKLRESQQTGARR